jgi:zinc and cadmium transporter
MAAVLVGALVVLAVGKLHRAVIPTLLAFAAGTLLGVSLLRLVPEAAAYLPVTTVAGLALVAIVIFFLLEKWVLWRHCHDNACSPHSPAGFLMLVGDGVHNAVDGLVVGAAFLADPGLGLSVGLAVLAHEIPQEVGDFVLLLEGGLAPGRALAYNLVAAATILPGILGGFLLAEALEPVVGLVLGIAAGAFLYVALADLVPVLHQRSHQRAGFSQVVPMLAGIALIWIIEQVAG